MTRTYHMPRGRHWNAPLLVEVLQKRGVKATLDGERVVMTLLVKRCDIVNAHTVEDFMSAMIGEDIGVVSATLSFIPMAVLENIRLKVSERLEADCYPQIDEVTNSLLECGYVTLNHRELANKYYTGEIDLNALFDTIEELQIDKIRAIEEYRFDDAGAKHERVKQIKQQIEDLLRSSIRDD
jgi:hypothetical protein